MNDCNDFLALVNFKQFYSFAANSLNSVLSQKLLAQHNAGFGESSIELDDDIQSCGSKSVVSSIASNCTNATFNKILGRIVTSQSSLNTQVNTFVKYFSVVFLHVFG